MTAGGGGTSLAGPRRKLGAARAQACALALAALCWTVQAWPLAVVDGDTVDVRVSVPVTLRAADTHVWLDGVHVEDLELTIVRRERVRLLGVDAPEITGPTREAGLRAREYVTRWLNGEPGSAARTTPLLVRACSRDSFGRALATVTRGDANLGDDLVAAGHAVRRP